MKWSVIAGCSAFLALGCSGTSAGTGETGSGDSWSVPGSVAGSWSAVGGYAGAVAQGGSSSIPPDGVPAGGYGPFPPYGVSTGGSGPIPPDGVPVSGGSGSVPTYGGATASGGDPGTAGGGEPVPAGGAGPITQGGGSAIDPNSCSHDVARCFDAAAACFEYSSWSDCGQIVDVCAAMEAECNPPTGGTATGVAGTGGVGTSVAGTGGAPG